MKPSWEEVPLHGAEVIAGVDNACHDPAPSARPAALSQAGATAKNVPLYRHFADLAGNTE
eukprot:6197606-Pleurochrysis_carterae.AAC.1